MPRTGNTNVTGSSPVPHLLLPFKFPTDHHLIITTSGGIFSWDRNGIKRLFNSSKKGILAAREANDGSQLLAVADKRVVVLHDCKKGREESWGLDGEQGQVRLLEYAPDAKSLFLSTSLTGAIQRYSMNESRLLDPASSHPSPPTVLAVSPSSHLMLSASEDPPVVYLQNLTLNTPAMQMHPSASDRAVVAASFHPERPNVFMLAFKDGTLAAYDATRMARRAGVRVNALPTDGRAGEIAHFAKLHRITNVRDVFDPQEGALTTAIGSKSVGITGAAFLPGFRTRAVSVGADGRCRIVDFEAGGRILRTWHAQAPVTSLSVLAVKETSGGKVSAIGNKKKTESRMKPVVMGGPNSTNSVIAVGRVDGQVLLFDSLGLKLDHTVVDKLGERIISVEWMKGPSPNAMSIDTVPSSSKKEPNGLESPAIPWIGKESHSQSYTALQPPPTAIFPTPTEFSLGYVVTEEGNSATVRRVPEAAIKSSVPLLSPHIEANYLDLFSPVKQVTSPAPRQLRGKPETSPRILSRPRVSSRTFVRNSSPESTPESLSPVKPSPRTPRQLSIHPLSTNITSEKRSASGLRGTPISARRGSSRKASSKKARRRAISKMTPNGISSFADVPSAAKRNGQVLADLRRLGAGVPSQGDRKSSNLALFAPYMNRTGVSDLPRPGKSKTSQHDGTKTRNLEEQTQEEHVLSPDREKVKVHFDTDSQPSDRDIWLTAGSLECEKKGRVKGRQNQVEERHYPSIVTDQEPMSSRIITQHEPKLQISRFSPESDEVTVVSPQPQARGRKADVLPISDEAMFSAASRFSPLAGSFNPGSKDMRRISPRGSSLSSLSSPHHSSKKLPRKGLHIWTDGETKDVVDADGKDDLRQKNIEDERKSLANLQPNALQAIRHTTQRHSSAKNAAIALLHPSQMQKFKTLPALPPPTPGNEAMIPEPLAQNPIANSNHTKECGSRNCSGCKTRDVQVRDLKDEVARLRAEVLGLRMQVRKNTASGGGAGGGVVGVRLGRRNRGVALLKAVPGKRT